MKKKILSVILTVVLCFSSIGVSATPSPDTASRYLEGILDIIADNYKYGVSKEELYSVVLDYLIRQNPENLEGAFKAATEALDNYSVYYTADELTSFVSNVHQTYVGIGVTVQKSPNGCLVTDVNKNGGAFDAGVTAGDEITAVDGTIIKDMSLDDITVLIQGKADTKVSVEILRNGTPLTLDITRRKINIDTVAHEIIDDIAYINISTFADGTTEELKTALNDIEEVHKLNKIIIDVRDNPGGELNSIISVLSLFVPKGKVLVKFEYKNEKYNYEMKSKATFIKAPKREIVILANENSASAAELFAGTMQYYKLAKVVGKTTFGKGSMQEMMGIIDPIDANLGDMKLTVAEFLKPNGDKINGIGVDPDYNVSNKFKDFDESVLTPMTISARYTIGDTHQDVLAIEERLSVLGYNVGEPDEVFDNLTYQATKNFQAALGLYSYGVMDYTTQSRLNDVIEEVEVEIDSQYEKAIEILK